MLFGGVVTRCCISAGNHGPLLYRQGQPPEQERRKAYGRRSLEEMSRFRVRLLSIGAMARRPGTFRTDRGERQLAASCSL